ncbi:tetratricopeptide repeat protein, partial [Pseudomonas aeruginosa]|uniref:tetratricopeptide repeat protein n=1 Tax=Pseudomonas aeruginosa TaxID=287 RepID=UPI0024B6BDF8
PLEVAQALFAEGRIGDAEATLKALLAENNENAAALILYARCLAERGELEEAPARACLCSSLFTASRMACASSSSP